MNDSEEQLFDGPLLSCGVIYETHVPDNVVTQGISPSLRKLRTYKQGRCDDFSRLRLHNVALNSSCTLGWRLAAAHTLQQLASEVNAILPGNKHARIVTNMRQCVRNNQDTIFRRLERLADRVDQLNLVFANMFAQQLLLELSDPWLHRWFHGLQRVATQWRTQEMESKLEGRPL